MCVPFELIEALERQTSSINRLIESNTALMAYLIEMQIGDEEVAKTYMDGSPCR